MELSEMTPKELVRRLEIITCIRTSPGYTSEQVDAAWAELKKRCEAVAVCPLSAKGRYFVCDTCDKHGPCPLLPTPCPEYRGEKLHWVGYPAVGEGEAHIHGCPLYPCPKCGEVLTTTPGRICSCCLNSRPDAPKGYEHVNEWRDPALGEYYLNYMGALVHYMNPEAAPSQNIDGGKRWILRAVAEVPKCDKCGKPAKPDNVKESTWYVCPDGSNICWHCYYTRPPVKDGFEYTGEWRPATENEYYLAPDGTFSRRSVPYPTQEAVWILRKKPEGPKCPKCGQEQSWPTELAPTLGQEQAWFEAVRLGLCAECRNARPNAPAGFEHVGEWRPPKYMEYFFSEPCHVPMLYSSCPTITSPRWILRKVEEYPGRNSFGDIVSRVEKLEQETP